MTSRTTSLDVAIQILLTSFNVPIENFTYAKSKRGVWFARKDEIADWALKTATSRRSFDRGPVTKTGLSGPAN